MRKTLLALLLVVTIVLGACGPAMPPATTVQTEGGETFVIALPRIVIDFDANGNPSVLGLNLVDLGRYLGQNLSTLRLPQTVVERMTATNVQHLEIRQTGQGMAVFANGKPLPYLGWTDASLQQVSDLTGLLNMPGLDTEMLRKVVPVVRRLGLDLVLRFPKPAGAADVALIDSQAALKITPAPTKDAASAIVHFEIKYDDRGQPAILGISTADLAQRGINSAPLDMPASTLNLLKARNIQHLELRSKADGLFVFVNGQALPNIVWDNALLNNAADLYVQMDPGNQYGIVIKQFVPLIDKADIAVLLHFPLAAGAQPIAAQMH